MAQAMAATSTSPNLYKVQKGDTLLGIANKFHISAKQLASDNKKQLNDNLVMNEILLLPNELFTTSAIADEATPTKPSVKSNVVKTVPSKVATKTPNSTSSVLTTTAKTPSTTTTKNPFYDANQNTPNQNSKAAIAPQTTYKPLNTSIYTIKNGDSLTSLVKKYNTTVSHLLQLNPTSKIQKLTIGQKLIVPATTAQIKPAITPTKTVATPKPTSKITIETYNVKDGDTLSAVANRYNLTVNDIAKINQIMPDMAIKVGQTLMIPIATNAQAPSSKD